MRTTQGLEQRTRFLRNAAPHEFAEFLTEFMKYTDTMRDNVVHATENLQLEQGRAQQCINLLRVFEEINRG